LGSEHLLAKKKFLEVVIFFQSVFYKAMGNRPTVALDLAELAEETATKSARRLSIPGNETRKAITEGDKHLSVRQKDTADVDPSDTVRPKPETKTEPKNEKTAKKVQDHGALPMCNDNDTKKPGQVDPIDTVGPPCKPETKPKNEKTAKKEDDQGALPMCNDNDTKKPAQVDPIDTVGPSCKPETKPKTEQKAKKEQDQGAWHIYNAKDGNAADQLFMAFQLRNIRDLWNFMKDRWVPVSHVDYRMQQGLKYTLVALKNLYFLEHPQWSSVRDKIVVGLRKETSDCGNTSVAMGFAAKYFNKHPAKAVVVFINCGSGGSL
jgi:hypothetical protein